MPKGFDVTTTYDVMPERGFTETYYILDDAHDVADGMEVSGDGPVEIWANTAVGRVRLR
jgi:hypothetical protein